MLRYLRWSGLPHNLFVSAGESLGGDAGLPMDKNSQMICLAGSVRRFRGSHLGDLENEEAILEDATAVYMLCMLRVDMAW